MTDGDLDKAIEQVGGFIERCQRRLAHYREQIADTEAELCSWYDIGIHLRETRDDRNKDLPG